MPSEEAPNGQQQARVEELKATARRLLAADGPSAVSLRAIARNVGMTAPAIYRYFPSLDALVEALCADLFDELRGTVGAARGTAAGDDPIARITEMCRAFRRWALANPHEFGLMFGPRLPGVTEMWGDAEEPRDPGFEFGAAFLTEFARLWRSRPLRTPPDELIERQLGPHMSSYLKHRGEDLPLAVVFIFLSSWTSLYGFVAMEVFGLLKWAMADAGALFELELANLAQQLTGEDPRRR